MKLIITGVGDVPDKHNNPDGMTTRCLPSGFGQSHRNSSTETFRQGAGELARRRCDAAADATCLQAPYDHYILPYESHAALASAIDGFVRSHA